MVGDRILELSRGSDAFQRLVGAPAAKRRFVERRVAARPGQRVLDVGCGTGALLEFLPAGAEYVGVDVSREYVEAARRRHGARGTFVQADAAELARAGEAFDVATAFGLLHHLDDAQVRRTLAAVRGALAPLGRLVAVEPCVTADRGALEAFLMRRDRGRFIRTPAAYAALAEPVFPGLRTDVLRGELRIPYALVVLESRPAA